MNPNPQRAEDLPQIFTKYLDSQSLCEKIFSWISELPPFPHIATRALRLIEAQEANANKLSTLLGKDVVLAARVLKIANSLMYAQKEITTINQAIMLLGSQTLKGIIIAASLKQFSKNSTEADKLIWENSVATALASEILNKQLKKDYENELFILSLLRNLGKFALSRQAPTKYQEVLKLVSNGASFLDAERKVFGFSHPLAGALLLHRWNFPEEIIELVLTHHSLNELKAKPALYEKALIISTANSLAHIAGYGNPNGFAQDTAYLIEALSQLKINTPQTDLVEELKLNFSKKGESLAAS